MNEEPSSPIIAGAVDVGTIHEGSERDGDTDRTINLAIAPIVPRYMAALLDNVVAMILAIVVAKSVTDELPLVQFGSLVSVYLAYFFLFEAAFSRTPGKFSTGIVVVRVDGRRPRFSQTAIRTGFRFLEVNPILLGAIPAALCIIFSPLRQRFGDKLARTVVVQSQH